MAAEGNESNATLPQQHPYVAATREAERVFRLKHQVLIGITTRTGDVFTVVDVEPLASVVESDGWNEAAPEGDELHVTWTPWTGWPLALSAMKLSGNVSVAPVGAV